MSASLARSSRKFKEHADNLGSHTSSIIKLYNGFFIKTLKDNLAMSHCQCAYLPSGMEIAPDRRKTQCAISLAVRLFAAKREHPNPRYDRYKCH